MHDLMWRPEARAQLAGVFEYIAERNPNAAQRLKDSIYDRIALAQVVPFIGRPGRATGTRELFVHPNYVVIDSVTDETVTVLRVLHSRQRYP